MIYHGPRPSSGSDKVLANSYARKADGTLFYPTDQYGNQYRIPNLGLIKNGDRYIYPISAIGKPIYRYEKGSQVYEIINGKPIIGVGIDGNQYYAINQLGSEYYPDDNSPATLRDGTPYYASDINGIHIFPVDASGNEYYFNFIDLTKPSTIPRRYATSYLGDEIYPIRQTADNNEEQYMILNTYAKDKNKKPFYPKDGFKNEYYKVASYADIFEYKRKKTIGNILLDRYALTNDGKIILPMIDNQYVIDSEMKPVIKSENVIGRLIRENDELSNYLTNVTDDTFKVTHTKPYNYKTLITNETQLVIPKQASTVVNNFIGIFSSTSFSLFRRWCFWFLLFVLAIVKMFAVWWFFFKKPEIIQHVKI